MRTRELVLTGLMMAVVFVITRVVVLPIPQTKGFFNLGEAGVYLAALLFGPRVGGLAGGIGSALADLTVPGAAVYAPFTLVIKGVEGAVVGAVAHGAGARLRALGLAAGAVAAAYLVTVSAWPARLAALVLVAAVIGGYRRPAGRLQAGLAARLVGMLVGGAIMVGGYFFTQAFVLRLGVPVALVEVPYNLVQVAVGLAAGLTAAVALERAVPGLGR